MTVGLQKSSYQPDSTCHNLFSTTYQFLIKRGHKGIQALHSAAIIINIHFNRHFITVQAHPIKVLRIWHDWFSSQFERVHDQYEINQNTEISVLYFLGFLGLHKSNMFPFNIVVFGFNFTCWLLFM